VRPFAGLARVVLVGTAIAATLNSAFPGSKAPPPFRVVAGAPSKEKPPPGSPPGPAVARTSLKGLTVSVEYADAARRAGFLDTLSGDAHDPFAAAPGRPERYLTFVVVFDNQAPKDVVFQPENVSLITDVGQQAFPLDVTDLYVGAEQAGVEDLQKVVDRTTAILFDGSTVIPSGQRMARLLAFPRIESPHWKQFKVHFSFLQIGAETHTISFTFHKEVVQN
jgi:hypothetical protein